jgi:hypothetical protein
VNAIEPFGIQAPAAARRLPANVLWRVKIKSCLSSADRKAGCGRVLLIEPGKADVAKLLAGVSIRLSNRCRTFSTYSWDTALGGSLSTEKKIQCLIDRLNLLAEKIKEVQKRLPAHSVKPLMMRALLKLEDESNEILSELLRLKNNFDRHSR